MTSSKAIGAYERGFSGTGIKVGVVDSGINPSLAEFAGRIDPLSADVAGNRGVSDDDGHGTAVAAVIAAAKNDSGMHGVAYGATIVAFRTDDPGSCGTADDCAFYESDIAAGIDQARIAGARVINLSLGGSPPSSGLLAAMQRAVNAGIVLVIAAGNEGDTPEGANPNGFALVPAQNFPGKVIIAGSIGTAGDPTAISTFSNQAGSGANHYLTALGYRVRTINHLGQDVLYSGTSLSTPVISGAVALLAQAFPNLTGQQIIEILFKSADDLGAAGIDAVYGRGALNITRAFQPIGTTTVAGTAVVLGTETSGDLPAAGGDPDDPDGKLGAIILDGYSRAFTMNLAAGLRRAEASRPLSRALSGNVRVSAVSAGPLSVAMSVAERHGQNGVFDVAALGIGPEDAQKAKLVAATAIARLDRKTAVAFGFAEGAKAIERRLANAEAGAFLIAKDIAGEPGFAAKRGASMAVRRSLGPVNLTVSGEEGEVWQDVPTRATGSPYRWTSATVDKDFGRSWASFSLSRLDEKHSLLGGRVGEALGGGGGSTSTFLDLELRHRFGRGISAAASARRGWTSFAGGNFETGAYAVDVTKTGIFGAGDRLGLRVSQPLRIEKGGFALMLPTEYDYSTGLATNSLSRFSLRPSGREIDGEVSYMTALGMGWVSGNLFYRHQPDHRASADADVGAAVRYTLRF